MQVSGAPARPERVRVSAYGESALLVHLDDLAGVHQAYARLRAAALPGVVDLVPAARTLLVVTDRAAVDPGQVERTLGAPSGPADEPAVGDLVRIPVVYDGEDLPVVADLAGLPVDEVIDRHSRCEYVAAFCGFLPGFAYLTTLDERLQVPRLRTPRVRVPAGSVAIADRFTAVYPRSSPGGWLLLGRTDLALFDVERDPPALITPTTRVRFEPVSA